MLRKMAPEAARDDGKSIGLADAEFERKFVGAPALRSKNSHPENVVIRKLGPCVPGPLSERIRRAPLVKFCPSFGDHVSRVVEPRSEKKVVWSDARPVIALVQNTKPAWNLSASKDPGDPMSKLRTPDAPSSCVDLAVPVAVERSVPLPAIVCLAYVVPKVKASSITHVPNIT